MISAALAIIKTDEERNILSAFYIKNKDRLLAIAFSKLHSKSLAEDAVEEAFMQIATKPDKFFGLTDEEKIRYFDVVVKNLSIRMFDNSIKRNYENIDDHEAELVNPISLEDDFFDGISHNEIIDFIKNLPQLQKSVLFLTRLNGLSIEDTAQALNVSKTVVNQRLYLARKAIKRFIVERREHNG